MGQLSCSMWNLPRPETEPMSSALTGRFFTTESPEKPWNFFFFLATRYHRAPWLQNSQKCKGGKQVKSCKPMEELGRQFLKTHLKAGTKRITCPPLEHRAQEEEWEQGLLRLDLNPHYSCLTKDGSTKSQESGMAISSVQFSRSVVSDSLQPHESKHARHPVHHQLLELTQTHVHRVGDAIQPSHPLSSPSPPAPNPSQHQGLFQ